MLGPGPGVGGRVVRGTDKRQVERIWEEDGMNTGVRP